ncbi:MAG: hypothetical protein JW718_00680 [Desulfovibrionaceae bacterium]|nr:hypothetical protein [Desulfovibrionaceae bacterium]
MAITLPRFKGKTALERVVRILALVLIALVVCWAFWKNNERVMERLNANKAVYDQTDSLGPEDLEFVRGFVDGLEREFGIAARIQVRTGRVEVPELDPKTLYIGLWPDSRQAVVVFPVLMRRSLGEDLARTLQDRHFPRYFDDGDWPRGLRVALAIIWSRLAEMVESGRSPDRSGVSQVRRPVDRGPASP